MSCKINDTLVTESATSNVTYNFNYQYFFKDKNTYNKELSTISSIFASVVYDKNRLEHNTDSSSDNAYVDELMRNHGFDNVIIYKLANMYDD